MIWSSIMFKEEGYKLMGAAFEVYNEIGYGMAEDIYRHHRFDRG